MGERMEYIYFYETIIGTLGICEDELGITDIYLAKDNKSYNNKELKETELIKEAARQIKEYLKGERKEFTLPLHLKGTEFQRKVWEALSKIEYGATVCYKDVAIHVGNEKASRAVGMANNKNPILIVIPCHRVIGKNGSLVGYGGGLELKSFLLKLEKDSYKPSLT